MFDDHPGKINATIMLTCECGSSWLTTIHSFNDVFASLSPSFSLSVCACRFLSISLSLPFSRLLNNSKGFNANGSVTFNKCICPSWETWCRILFSLNTDFHHIKRWIGCTVVQLMDDNTILVVQFFSTIIHMLFFYSSSGDHHLYRIAFWYYLVTVESHWVTICRH